VHRALVARLGQARALAAAAAASQAVAGAVWALVMLACLRQVPGALGARATLGWAAAVAAIVWAAGVLVGSRVALGVGRFMAGGKPELLPDEAAHVVPTGGMPAC